MSEISLNDPPDSEVDLHLEENSSCRTSPKILKAASFLFCLGIPLFILFAWHAENTLLPNDDAADFYLTTQKIFLKFENEGWVDGIIASYTHRGWRPIVYPSVGVPFILMADGDIKLTVGLTLGFVYAVFLGYTFFLICEFLPPGRAVLGTLAVGLNQWVANITHYYLAEILLLACSMSMLYHLKRSNFSTPGCMRTCLELPWGLVF